MNPETHPDEAFMSRALQLGVGRLGLTSPNPAVGAVLAAEGRIIGEGATSFDGGPHAEVLALSSVRDRDRDLLRGATLFVTLEPCSYTGRTPPCTSAIIAARIPRVVVGAVDFTPGVCGRGLSQLRRAGVEVTLGTCQEPATALARYRNVYAARRRPYVILKQARTVDGYAGLKFSQLRITQTMANTLSHQWRTNCDAILVGVTTATADDPALTARLATGASPTPVLLDPSGRAPAGLDLLKRGSQVYWAVDAGSAVAQSAAGLPAHVTVLPLDGASRLRSLLTHLHDRRVGTLLVEGGPATLEGFVAEGLYDEVREWTGAVALGPATGGVAAATLPGGPARTYVVGGDRLRVAARVGALSST